MESRPVIEQFRRVLDTFRVLALGSSILGQSAAGERPDRRIPPPVKALLDLGAWSFVVSNLRDSELFAPYDDDLISEIVSSRSWEEWLAVSRRTIISPNRRDPESWRRWRKLQRPAYVVLAVAKRTVNALTLVDYSSRVAERVIEDLPDTEHDRAEREFVPPSSIVADPRTPLALADAVAAMNRGIWGMLLYHMATKADGVVGPATGASAGNFVRSVNAWANGSVEIARVALAVAGDKATKPSIDFEHSIRAFDIDEAQAEVDRRMHRLELGLKAADASGEKIHPPYGNGVES